MKTIVYKDGSIESTVWAEEEIKKGNAREATEEEKKMYNRWMADFNERRMEYV